MKVVNRRGNNSGPSGPAGPPPPINIDPNELEDIVCEKCGNPTFVPASLFKKLPASLSPTGKATLVPLQVFECSVCKHVNEEFLPKMPSSDE
tara:strand:+ start:451 stop:726 length:276 start_codon:yes stop_codon:yes gene_type:complete